MSWRRLRRILLLGLLAAAAIKAVRSLRGPEAPAFTRHPSAWDGGPTASPTETTSTPIPSAAPAPHVVAEPTETSPAPDPSSGRLWVEPVDGGCAPGHPVKAKERSGIYHEPGMMAYDRTNPDRCYRSATDAEADGFRAAKR